MADGDVAQYEKIKQLDVLEFYSLYERWKEILDIKIKSLREKGAKQ